MGCVEQACEFANPDFSTIGKTQAVSNTAVTLPKLRRPKDGDYISMLGKSKITRDGIAH